MNQCFCLVIRGLTMHVGLVGALACAKQTIQRHWKRKVYGGFGVNLAKLKEQAAMNDTD